MSKSDFFSKLFSFYLSLLPLIMWHGSYEGPKLYYFSVGGVLLFLFWVYRIAFLKKNIVLGKADAFFLSWLGTLVLSSIFGVHPFDSIIGGSYRHEGIIFFLTLWLIYKTLQIFSSHNKKFLYRLIAYSVLIESIIVFAQYGSGKLYFGKPLGTIGESNAVAGFLAIGSYFVFTELDTMLFAFPIISILIAESKSGLLAILPNLLIVARSLKEKFRKAVTLFIVVAGLGLLVVSANEKVASPFENRSLIWRLGISQVLHKPILGYGAESGEFIYNKAYKENNLELNGLVIDRAHNLLIDVSIWSGVVGLILFVGFLVAFYKEKETIYKKMAFVSFLIYSFFQPLSVVHWLLLILL